LIIGSWLSGPAPYPYYAMKDGGIDQANRAAGPVAAIRVGSAEASPIMGIMIGWAEATSRRAVACHFREPLGVVGQIIPFNFPLLMAAWKLAPAFAAGNCSVLKPASPTPWSILKLAEVIGDLLPPGGSTSPAGYLPGLHRPGAGPDRDDPAG